MTIIKTKQLSTVDIRKYIEDNCIYIACNFWRVDKPLKVWKRTNTVDKRCIVALEIPVEAVIYCPNLFSSYTHSMDRCVSERKMRASEAKVIQQYSYMRDVSPYPNQPDMVLKYNCFDYEEIQNSYSLHDSTFKYHTGRNVKPTTKFDRDTVTCTSGIHFFVNLCDALYY